MSSIQPLITVAKNAGSIAAGVSGAYSVTLALQCAVRGALIVYAEVQKRRLPEEKQAKFNIYERVGMGDGWLQQIKHQTLYVTQNFDLKKTVAIAVGMFALSTALSKLCGTPSFANRIFSILPIGLNLNNQILKAVKL